MYAALYWAIHCKLTRGKKFSKCLRELLFQFLSEENDSKSSFATWTTILGKLVNERAIGWRAYYKYDDIIESSQRTLLFACVFDFVEVMQDQIIKESF